MNNQITRMIKFRVWNKKKLTFDSCFDYMIDREGSLHYFSNDGLSESLNLENYVIQQYTGFKDKNNREIYEGDIIFSDEMGLNGVSDTYEVVWNDDICLGYGWGLWSTEYLGYRCLDGFSIYEIIGHVYDSNN